MFPETDFYRKRNLIFLIIDHTYYNISNSGDVNENYLNLCELRFPLTKGRSLLDEEKNYIKKNSKKLQDFKTEIEKQITKEGKHIGSIKESLEVQEDIHFFLSKICQPHNPDAAGTGTESSVQRTEYSIDCEESLILPQILNENYAIINQRIYPLQQIQEPIFVSLEGKNYTINTSIATPEEVEGNFQKILEERIKVQALSDSKKVGEILQNIDNLQEKIIHLTLKLNAKKYDSCYECGDIGYDFRSRLVYWLIPAHYNETTGKSYGEGQSAGTLSLIKKNLGTTLKFADRNERNSPFRISSKNHCHGDLKLGGNSLEDKMAYLRAFRMQVDKEKKFYQSAASTNDNYDYQSYY